MTENEARQPTQGICFVDCETTGLLRDVHEIWEVGLITAGAAHYQWMLPVDVTKADPVALDIGGYHQRHPKGNAPNPGGLTDTADPIDFAREFTQLTHGCHLVGAVIDFDADMLRRLIRAQGFTNSWHYHLIDVENLAAGYLLGLAEAATRAEQIKGLQGEWRRIATPPYDSEELSKAVGVEPGQFTKHQALEDAAWAKAIYQKVYG